MFNSVPTRGDVFFQPLSYAAEAFIVMGIFGLVVLGADGAMVLGGSAAVFAWLIGFVVWLSILRERYAASAAALLQEAQASPMSVPVDEVPRIAAVRYTARNEDGSRQLVLKPPCEASQLHQFAVGMMHEQPTTVDFWTVKLKEFGRDEFSNFRSWLVSQNFAQLVEGNKLLMTVDGLEMCEWVFYRGLQKLDE
jgi:hypothetical protein